MPAGGSRGVAPAFAALVDPAWRGGGMCVCAGSFSGARTPLSPGVGKEMKLQKSVIFLKNSREYSSTWMRECNLQGMLLYLFYNFCEYFQGICNHLVGEMATS